MDGIAKLASLLKDRDNQPYLGPQVGVVVEPPPNLRISLGDKIILDKDNLIIAAHVLADYQRELEITGGIDITGVTGKTTLIQPPPPEEPAVVSETWGMQSTSLEGQEKITGKMKYTDTLKPGDEVILIPSTDEQRYFVVDKAVRL